MAEDIDKDPRVYFAAERTLLAWIRTGLALMGVGFAVSRFGLYLRQLASIELRIAPHSTGVFVWGGAALVVVGVFINIFAAMNHVRIIRELAAGTWTSGRPSKEGVALALLLAVMGVATAVYVIIVR
jgi:putative membrane protein